MVVMLNGLFAKQTVVLLHFGNSIFKAPFLVERSLLILPFLNVRIIKPHEREFVDFQHSITDRKKLLNFLYQIDVCLEQLICGGCKPSFQPCAIGVLCFFVFDANAKYIFLASRKMTFDNTNFFCTFARILALGSILLYTLLRNGAICLSSPLTAAASAICAPCAAGFFAVLHQFWNLFIASFQMCGKDCRAICFDYSNTNIGSAGVNA